MSQTQKVQGRATRVFTDDNGALCVLYHHTVVAKRAPVLRKEGAPGPNGLSVWEWEVTLDSGGWRTVTTKIRINQFANQHCGGAFSLRQLSGEWFVTYPGRIDAPFVDRMTFKIA